MQFGGEGKKAIFWLMRSVGVKKQGGQILAIRSTKKKEGQILVQFYTHLEEDLLGNQKVKLLIN